MPVPARPPFPALFALALVAGCASGPPTWSPGTGVGPAAPSAEPTPGVVTLEGGAPFATPFRATPRPSTTPSPAARASVRPSGASPTPAPTPRPLEFDAAFVRVPPGWKAERSQREPVDALLVPTYGQGSFRLTAEPTGRTSESLLADAKAAAGEGLVRAEATLLDDVKGWLVAANRDTAEGKRYVVTRGFLYRGRFWKLETSWDKRAEAAGKIETDVQLILRGFKWL